MNVNLANLKSLTTNHKMSATSLKAHCQSMCIKGFMSPHHT